MLNLDKKQSIRLKNTLLAAMGGAVMSAGIIYAQVRGFNLIPNFWVTVLLIIFWLLNIAIISLIITGLNLRFRDPSMSLFQMYWASLSAAVALGLVYNIDVFFYLLTLLPMIFGIFRVPGQQFQGYALVISLSLLLAIVIRSFTADVNIDLLDEFVIWLSFVYCAVTLSLLCKSVARLQTRLRDQNEQLKNALKARSYFLANMSHEIRTPLNGVLGMLDISLRQEINDSVKYNLMIAKESSKSLLTVINDILDFSKIEAGKLELAPLNFNLTDFLNDIAMQFKAAAVKKGIELIVTYDRNLPTSIFLDSSRLNQILNNLVANAIKFTARGSVKLSVNVLAQETKQEDKAILCFSVEDTGIGIPENKIDILFEHFSQVDVTTTRKYGGTGLGLAIAKNLCRLMGGDIIVSSKEGVGSTFTCNIPVIVSDIVINSSPKAKQVFPSYGQNTRVLLVEDNLINQEVAQFTLQEFGLHVDIANNGEEALSILTSKNHTHPIYQLIFMDCQMPILDGYEATKRIRTDPNLSAYAQIPIIAITAHAMHGDREKCLDSGMSDYATKPIDMEKISHLLNRWLDLKCEVTKLTADECSTKNNNSKATDEFNNKQLKTWNQDNLLKMLRGKQDRIVRLMTSFSSTFEQSIESILKAIEEQNTEELSAQIHALKGSSANLQFEVLSDICKSIESCARQIPPDYKTISTQLEIFILETSEVKKTLKSIT